MGLRIKIALAFCFASSLWHFAFAAQDHEKNAVVVTLRLDKSEILADEKVTMEELIPSALAGKVVGVRHKVLRIGSYDNEVGKIVNKMPEEFRPLEMAAFQEIQAASGGSHAKEYEINTEKEKGFKFTFQADRLGVFLITAVWALESKESVVLMSSNPVVLVVKPPLDAKGKAIVKKEWLKGS